MRTACEADFLYMNDSAELIGLFSDVVSSRGSKWVDYVTASKV